MPWRWPQGVATRLIAVAAASLCTVQCTTPREADRFRVGQSSNAFVIIGVAEAAQARHPEYAVLWRQIDPRTGGFEDYTMVRAFEARTNDGDSLRVAGLPGEFLAVEIEPGAYALDSVFGAISDGGVVYIAQGVIAQPQRPSFEVAAGEAIYLGIWEASLEGHNAVVRPWRLEERDLQLVANEIGDVVIGGIRMREARAREVPCTLRYMSNFSERQIC